LKSKKLVFLFLFPGFLCAAGSAVDKFNRSVEAANKKKYKEAITILEGVKSSYPASGKVKKIKIDYNLGTLYCHRGKIQKCISVLEEAFIMDPDNEKIRKNLELAYSSLPPRRKKKPDGASDRKKENKREDKKKSFEKKFKTQIKSMHYSEKRVLKRQFSKKMNNRGKRLEKDW